jgi:hypothetical protein
MPPKTFPAPASGASLILLMGSGVAACPASTKGPFAQTGGTDKPPTEPAVPRPAETELPLPINAGTAAGAAMAGAVAAAAPPSAPVDFAIEIKVLAMPAEKKGRPSVL